MAIEYDEIQPAPTTDKKELLGKPLRISSVEERMTSNGKANLVVAENLETKQEVRFFLAIERSSGFTGKTVVIKTALSEKRGKEYYYLQEIRLK